MLIVDVVVCLAAAWTALQPESFGDLIPWRPHLGITFGHGAGSSQAAALARNVSANQSLLLWQDGELGADTEPEDAATAQGAPARGLSRYTGTGTRADLNNHANQMNPNNWRYWSSRGMSPPGTAQGATRGSAAALGGYTGAALGGYTGAAARSPPAVRRGYTGTGTKADLDNHANQMNPNNWRYWSSRGVAPPWAAQGAARSPTAGYGMPLPPSVAQGSVRGPTAAGYGMPPVPLPAPGSARGGYTGTGTQADLDHRDNQMNPNGWRYWSSRGLLPPWYGERCGQPVRRLEDGDTDAGRFADVCVDGCMCHGLVECNSQSCYASLVDSCTSGCGYAVDLWLFVLGMLWVIKVGAAPCFGWSYWKLVSAKKPAMPDPVPEASRAHGRDFGTGIYSELCAGVAASFCIEDASLCAHACCCYLVRATDTYASAGLGGFCSIFSQVLGISIFFPIFLAALSGIKLADAYLVARVMLAAYFSLKRAALRARLGGEGWSYADCLYALFCPYCTGCQEARQVDGALGVQVRCCCVLQGPDEMAIPLVGMPVTTEPPMLLL